MAHRQILTSPIRTPFPLNALQKIFLCTACKLYERLLGAKSGRNFHPTMFINGESFTNVSL